MADWTLIALDTPIAGSAQRYELTMASNRKVDFALDGPSKLSFSLPARHWQTVGMDPMVTDILLYRDDWCAQRYRLLSAEYTKKGEEFTADFTAVSYRDLLNAWIFHAGDTRKWTLEEQTEIAWVILNQGQSKEDGALGITRGLYPYTPLSITLLGDWSSDPADKYYYEVGKRKGEAIEELGSAVSGFEWDIEPDRTSSTTERTALKFNTWNATQRVTTWPRCPLVLDDGGSILSWSKRIEPTEYANIIYATGRYPTGVGNPDDPPPTAWAPSSGNPAAVSPAEGRWERTYSTDVQSVGGLGPLADSELVRRLDYQPQWTADLAPFKWNGPEEMWIGDYCRTIINDGPIEVDDDMRVHTIAITISDDGPETISLGLNRKPIDHNQFRRNLEKRLQALERR